LALFDHPENPGLIFTERPADMRRHAGEISFPGGRPEPGEDLTRTALREAEEEIGLDPDLVEIVGALPPVSTYVTGYKVHPVVGRIPFDAPLAPNPEEVAQIFHFRFEQLLDGYGMKRLVRRGVPFKTPTYTVSDHMIWGATARILQIFFEHLE
jgi:8-oxo-dGTP pyrophosphatase MutT (NUDIX family)